MAGKTVVKVLSDYFNVDDGVGVKRPVGEWSRELKEFTPDEKRVLAQEVCDVTGDTLA
jgi:hypothetical protein